MEENECVFTNIFSDLYRSNDSRKKSTKRLMTLHKNRDLLLHSTPSVSFSIFVFRAQL